MDAAMTAKLAKLLPMLGSSHDGEVVAAARAIERTLKGGGLTFHDLTSRLSSPPKAASTPWTPSPFDSAYYNQSQEDHLRNLRESLKREMDRRRKQQPSANQMFEIPSEDVIDVADALLACELNISQRAFVRQCKAKAAYGDRVPLSPKQYEWWTGLRDIYGV